MRVPTSDRVRPGSEAVCSVCTRAQGLRAAGDYVSDTAPEATPSYACVPRDTCPGDGLADPINKCAAPAAASSDVLRL